MRTLFIRLWWLVMVGILGLLAWDLTHLRLETDILGLLPESERDPALGLLRRTISGQNARLVFFQVRANQPETATKLARELEASLSANPLFEWVRGDLSSMGSQYYEAYFERSYAILPPEIRALCERADAPQALVDRVTRLLYRPESGYYTKLLAEDPLLIFPALAENWSEKGRQMALADGFLAAQKGGHSYRGLIAVLRASAMDQETQESLAETLATLRTRLRAPELRAFDPSLEMTGVVAFAADSRASIQRDIGLITNGSMLGVLLIVFLCFRSARALFLTWIPILVALLGAFAITHALFAQLHVITLVFGGSLIGVCIDYGFHFMAHHRLSSDWDAPKVMTELRPSLLLAAGTTLLAYLGLGMAPLPGLREIAVFSSVGILLSLFTVLVWFPLWFAKPHPQLQKPLFFVPLGNRLLRFWTARSKPELASLLLVLALFGGLGFGKLKVNDGIQELNGASKALQARDRELRENFKLQDESGYLLVKGANANQALAAMETLIDAAPSLKLGLSAVDFVPSEARQRENIALLSRLFHERRLELESAFAELGLDPALLANYAKRLEAAQRASAPIHLEEWLNGALSFGMRQLAPGQSDGEFTLLAPIQKLPEARVWAECLENQPSISDFHPVQQLSTLLASYRNQASRWVALAYLLVPIALCRRYRWRGGLAIFAPPLLAGLLALALLGWLGVSINIMHTLALILIMGIGVDYSIFMGDGSAHRERAMLALTLSALTTILTFGLLALSAQPALRAIGLTSFFGVCFSWLLCPLTARLGREP